MTTPFYPEGAVYYKKIEHNVDRYSRTPVAGLVTLGSTGEAVMLSDEERREVLRITAEVAAPEKVLIAGVGAESVVETLRLAEHAAKLKYDVALVRTPHFYRPQMKPEALLAFYRTVADRCPLPVLLYTVPVFTAYDLPIEVIVALAEHPNIIGIKESSGNVEKVAAMVAATAYLILRGARRPAAFSFRLAVLAKIIPVILLPFVLKRIGKRNCALSSAVFLGAYIPFTRVGGEIFKGTLTFARDWRFNAGFFALIRWLVAHFRFVRQ